MPTMRHRPLSSVLAVMAGFAVQSACSDARTPPPTTAHEQGPIVQARQNPDARTFSGRVPRLGPEKPRDTMQLHRVLGDSLDFASISAIQPLGNRMLVADAMMSKHVALLDLGTGAVLKRAGGDGEGPGEFRSPAWFFAEPAAPTQVWLYDFSNRRRTLVATGSGDDLKVRESKPMDVGASLERPIRLGTRIVANGLFTDYTLLVMDSTGTPRERIVADQPFPATRIAHAVGRRLLNRSYMDAAPSGERVALAYQWESRIDVFGPDGRRVGSVPGPRPTEAKYQVRDKRFFWDPQGEMAYTDVRATDRYIYALFCGCKEADDSDQRSQRVHVFRWNGDFVTELQLDRRVTVFAVPNDDSVLYAAVSEPYPAVGEWRLPSFLAAGRDGAGEQTRR
jgi:hypothetical protein